jgi:hypothetical protein
MMIFPTRYQLFLFVFCSCCFWSSSGKAVNFWTRGLLSTIDAVYVSSAPSASWQQYCVLAEVCEWVFCSTGQEALVCLSIWQWWATTNWCLSAGFYWTWFNIFISLVEFSEQHCCVCVLSNCHPFTSYSPRLQTLAKFYRFLGLVPKFFRDSKCAVLI